MSLNAEKATVCKHVPEQFTWAPTKVTCSLFSNNRICIRRRKEKTKKPSNMSESDWELTRNLVALESCI